MNPTSFFSYLILYVEKKSDAIIPKPLRCVG